MGAAELGRVAPALVGAGLGQLESAAEGGHQALPVSDGRAHGGADRESHGDAVRPARGSGEFSTVPLPLGPPFWRSDTLQKSSLSLSISTSRTFQDDTEDPTEEPTASPTTAMPTYAPTIGASDVPSSMDSPFPSMAPSSVDDACPYLYWGAQEGRGLGPLGTDQDVPDFVNTPVRDACAGSRHSFIIQEDGTPYVSGFIESFNAYKGHMGIPRDELEEALEVNAWVPVTEFRGPEGEELGYTPSFNRVYPGAGAPGNSRDMHSLLIDVSGGVYTTGNNDMGQLCHGSEDSTDVFTRVAGLPSEAKAAAVGLDFTLILLEDGSVWGCGSNENGELGLGRDVSSVDVPTRLPNLSNVQEVRAGLTFAIYRDGEGTIHGTGSNLFGQMCVSTEGEPYTSPTVSFLRPGTEFALPGRRAFSRRGTGSW